MDNATVAVLAVKNGIGNDVHRLLGHIAIGFAVHSRLLGAKPQRIHFSVCRFVDCLILSGCAYVGCVCVRAQGNTCRPLSLSLSVYACVLIHLYDFSVHSVAFHDTIDS